MVDDPLQRLGDRQREALPSEDPMPDDVQELLKPFEGDEREALLDGVFATLDETAEDASAVTELRPAGRSQVWVGAIVAMAAALVLWLALSGERGPTDPAWPAYEISRLEGGASVVRSSDEGTPSTLTLRASDTVDAAFSPVSPVNAPTKAVLLATPTSGAARLVPLPQAEVSASGAVRVRAKVSDILGETLGTWHIQILIGPPESLPRDRAQAERDGPWARVAFDLEIVSDPR